MSLLQQFRGDVSKEDLFNGKDILLLAVSGGVDSVVLCELCHQAGYDFIMAHCNFKLRGEESERDEAFVRNLGVRYGKPVFVQHFDTAQYAEEYKVSIQVAARELRYAWFDQVLQEQTAGSGRRGFILTAHHLDDNIETLLMKFFKGTGIAGMRGILPKQGKIVRPLLFATKEAILSFAAAHQLKWVEDSSNALDKYARNYVRHQVIPLLQSLYPEVTNNLADNINRFREVEMLYQQAVTQHTKKLLEFKGKEVHIPVLKLKQQQPLQTIVFEIVKEYGFTPAQVPEVLHLLDAASGKYVASSTHRVIRNRNWLIIAPVETEGVHNILVEEKDNEVVFANGTLLLQALPADKVEITTATNTGLVDLRQVQFPLLLRPWKAGDYFYPLGMPKKKKVARFLIDQKVSKTDKEKVWVVESNKKIIWIVGMRIDDRVKVTPATQTILKFEWKAGL